MSFDSLPLHLDTVDSTNSWIHENLHLSSGAVIYTLSQTEGRGRLGRQWLGSPGDSLAVSLLVDSCGPHIPVTWLPLLAGIAAREIIAKVGLAGVRLKWPNDLLVGNAKLAGILVEGTSDGRAVIGWGVNLRNPPHLEGEVTATALADHGIEIDDLVVGLVDLWRERVRALLNNHGADSMTTIETWKALYLSELSTLGRTVRVQHQDREVVGIATGIADDGGLILEYGNKSEPLTIHAGDVFHIERS